MEKMNRLQIREENKKHRPDLQEYNHGVLASLPNCISLTLTERIQLLDLSGLQPDNLSVTFSFTWGLDGSGDHSDYAQLSKSDYTTKQVMSVCFAIKEVKVVDGLGKQVNWSSSETGANRQTPAHWHFFLARKALLCSKILFQGLKVTSG